MLGEIASGLSIFDWFVKLLKKTPDEKKEAVTDRFIELFEKHGVYRNQVPRFFGHGLQINDFSSTEKLSAKLTHEILEAACELFKVRLEWLEGADKQIYDTHSFYKHPEDYAEFLSELNHDEEHRIWAQLVLSNDRSWSYDVLLILKEEIGFVGDKTIYRQHICGGDWIHKYGKCRADIAACIAMTQKESIFIRGTRLQAKIDTFCKGKGFVSDLFKLPIAYERDWRFRKQYEYSDWHPDEWIENPDVYLSGLRVDQWNKVTALELWLSYHEKGYMNTGYADNNSHKLFLDKLEKIS